MRFHLRHLFARQAARLRVLLLLAALAGYAVFIASHFAPDAGTSDTSGYENFARLLLDGRLTTPLRLPPGVEPADPFHFTPLGFRPWTEPGLLVPTYPIGVPLHLCATVPLFGWPVGATLVGILAAVGTLALTWWIGRLLGLAPAGATLAALAVAVSPMFVFSSIQIMSDTLATAWTCAAIACALQSRSSTGRGGCWPWLCGVATAMAVAVRPSNAVIIPALVLLLGRPRAIWRTGLAGLPFALLLAWLNDYLYGSPLRTGYGDPAVLFGLEWVPGTVAHYARWLPALLPFAVPALLGLPWLPWRGKRVEILGLLTWVVALAGFYATYRITHETWWCLRFLLPAFPVLAVLGAAVLMETPGRLSRLGPRQTRHATAILMAAIIAVLFLFGPRQTRDLHVLGVPANERRHRLIAEWAAAHIPKNALVVTMQASGALYFYTDLPILRPDLVTPEHFERYRRQAPADMPVFAILDHWELAADGQPPLPGPWEKQTEIQFFSAWRQLDPAPPADTTPAR